MEDDVTAPAEALDGAQAATETPDATPAASSQETPAEGVQGAEGGEGEPEFFPRSYVEKLRQESAGYRTAAQPYKEAFDGWDPDEVNAFVDFGKLIRDDPATAAQMAQQLAQQLEQEVQGPVEFAPDQPLTAADLQVFLQQHEAQRAAEENARRQSEAIEAINRRALELDPKYVPNSEDHFRLMYHANKQFQGDLEKSHAFLQSERQGIRDEVIAELKAAAAGGVQPVQAGSPAAPAVEGPKDVREAGRLARQRLIDMGIPAE